MRKRIILLIIFTFLAVSVFADGIDLSNLKGIDFSTLSNISQAKKQLQTYNADSLISIKSDSNNIGIKSDTNNIGKVNYTTAIESTYNAIKDVYNSFKPDSQKLRQFGYNIFKHITASDIVARSYTSENYAIAPGDRIIISITGQLVKQANLTVDNDGRIFIPEVGDVLVWGKTVKEAGKAIRNAIYKKFSNVNVDVSLGALHNIQVYVIGHVARPGIYNVSAMMSPIQIIYLAGGIKKTGTLRNIELISDKRYSFDFYKLILYGYRYKGIYLHSGDIVYVPPIGRTVALAGAFKTPGIYEFKPGETLKDLFRYSGGELPIAEKRHFQIVTTDDRERKVEDFFADSYSSLLKKYGRLKIKDGDMIYVPPMNNAIYNYVHVAGAVKLPGRYAYKKGLDLKSLIGLAGGFRRGAYTKSAFVYRYIDGTRDSIINVNLENVLNKKSKFMLNDWDSVYVFTEGEIVPNDSVFIYGAVKYPGLYVLKHGKSFKDIVAVCGGFNKNAFKEGIIYTRRLSSLNRARTNMLISMNQKLLATEAILSGDNSTLDEKSKYDLIQYRNDLLKIIAGAKDRNRLVIDVNDSSDMNTPLVNGDSIYVPEMNNTVQVIGAVYNPTTLMYRDGKPLKYYLDKVGGLKENADRKGMYVLRASGIVDKNTRVIYPGDAIVVPEHFVQRTDWGPILKDVATILSQLAVAVVSVYSIVKK